MGLDTRNFMQSIRYTVSILCLENRNRISNASGSYNRCHVQKLDRGRSPCPKVGPGGPHGLHSITREPQSPALSWPGVGYLTPAL